MLRTRSRSTTRAEKNAFYRPKQLMLLCIWFFITAIYVARTFAAIQRAGIITTGPNVIGDFHFHHWSFSFIALPVFMILAFICRPGTGTYKKYGGQLWGLFLIAISVLLGLFVDGIVYYDSAVFFEQNELVLQPLTMADIYFQLLLGAIWFTLTFILFSLMYRSYRKSNPAKPSWLGFKR